jgi:hypothetical protein
MVAELIRGMKLTAVKARHRWYVNRAEDASTKEPWHVLAIPQSVTPPFSNLLGEIVGPA